MAFRALAYERLGQIFDELGDAAGARQYHSRFVAMWANADEDLQPRVDIARARVGELSNEMRP